jgi:hypothetical protein
MSSSEPNVCIPAIDDEINVDVSRLWTVINLARTNAKTTKALAGPAFIPIRLALKEAFPCLAKRDDK